LRFVTFFRQLIASLSSNSILENQKKQRDVEKLK